MISQNIKYSRGIESQFQTKFYGYVNNQSEDPTHIL